MSAAESGRSPVTVRIAGEEHNIRADAEPDYTRRCARMVDERIRAIRGGSGLLEPHKAAILAALSLTDELLQARDEAKGLKDTVERRADELRGRIDEALSRE